ncbi:MAG: NAD(P)/FAD-dependent oxidoreductase [Chloroflexota bacterium]|jgi:NADH dehydrogenase
MERIVIAGAGYGGLNTALQLESRLSSSTRDDWEILLVDRNSYHQHIILIHEVAANSRAPEEVMVPFANILNGKRISFIKGEVSGVDLQAHEITVGSRRIEYDRLVIALGSESSFFGIPGANENTLTLKSVDDARRINAHIKRMFALARWATPEDRVPLLNFVVCGGGYSGVELTGELADWLPELAADYDVPYSKVRLIIVEAAPTILFGYPAGLPRQASEMLLKKGVELRLGSPVARIEPNMVYVKSGDMIPSRTIIWTGGVEASPMLAQWGLQTGAKGRAVVNGYLESVNNPGVYLVGDNCLVTNPSTGRPLAPSAQIALQEASIVADNIAAGLLDEPRRVFRPGSTAELFSVGRSRAFALIGRVAFDGYPARLLKEASALRYYLSIGGPGMVIGKTPESVRAAAGISAAVLQGR